MHRTVTGARRLCRVSVTHAVTEAHRPLLRSRLPFGVIRVGLTACSSLPV